MKIGRLVMASIVASLAIGATVTPAGAVKPDRLCPPAFEGPLTFQQVVDEFPPPPELPPDVVQAILDGIDMNNDGMLCAKGLPHAEDFIDNVANNPNDG